MPSSSFSSIVLALGLGLGAAACGGAGTGPTGPQGAQLAVTGLDPSAAEVTGGAPIVVHGQGFMAESRAIQVYFGELQANVISLDSDTEMVIEAPASQADGAVDVRVVFDPGGELVMPHAFTFMPRPAGTATEPAAEPAS